MARILTPFTVFAFKVPGTKDVWELIEDLRYHVGSVDSEEVIIARKGFRTDFSSAPFGVRNLFPKDDIDSAIAVIHDLLYRNKGLLPLKNFEGPKKNYSRKDCDKIYLEGMEVCGQIPWKRAVKYRALRWFGWYAWNKPENKPGRND